MMLEHIYGRQHMCCSRPAAGGWLEGCEAIVILHARPVTTFCYEKNGSQLKMSQIAGTIVAKALATQCLEKCYLSLI